MGIFMVSLLTALVAASVALWIAYIVYPLQKRQDRALKVQEEKAAIYRDFFAKCNAYFEDLKQGWRSEEIAGFDLKYPEVVQQSEALLLYAPAEVVKVCSEYTRALFEYRAHVRNELGKVALLQNMASRHRGHAYRLAETARDNALICARVDLLGVSESSAIEAVLGLRFQESDIGKDKGN